MFVRNSVDITVHQPEEFAHKFAVLKVRACELRAIAIQDGVFPGSGFVEADYETQRENNFIAGANCGQAGGTCLGYSMKCGPKAYSGFDLALIEVWTDERRYFVTETGSQTGIDILDEMPHSARY